MRDVPLSRHLARFSIQLPAPIMTLEPMPAVPQITLTVAEFEGKLQAARSDAQADASIAFERNLEMVESNHQSTMREALAAARAEWTATEADRLHQALDTAIAQLTATLQDRLAVVLRPLLVETLVLRAVDSFVAALDQLLSDPARSMITIKGPHDLVAAVQAARPASAIIEFQVADGVELSMRADEAYVETQLAIALAFLNGEAVPHVG